jgi:hypothetical protein
VARAPATRATHALVLALILCGALAAAAPAGAFTGVAVTTDPNALIRPPRDDVAPAGRHMSANQVAAIAARLSVVRAERRHRAGTYAVAFEKGFDRWQVSFFARGGRELAQVYVQDSTGRVLEKWTGFQVAWTMARGYPGAFGRKSNTLYVWLALSVLFVVPFVNPRRPLCMRHLDLIALSFFSVSLAFFNHANIGMSVPLNYPPLLYLLGRMLWMARRRTRLEPLALLVPASWLAVATVFLVGFRVGLNVTDSNVIDVGYAGVIGADRLLHGQAVYGNFPRDNEHGDTYGPVNYEVYVPAVAVAGWSGRWDDLPAAHIAAVFFDLLCMLLLFLLGRRVRGPTLGVALAYAWAAWPFTLFALSSDSNDSLVAALVLGAVLAASRPAARGAMTALAGLTKFAPLALAPLMAAHDWVAARGAAGPPPRHAAARFVIGFALAAALAFAPILLTGGIEHSYTRTLDYQASRGSPFSIWGLYGGLDGAQKAVQAVAVLLAVAVAFLPRRPDVLGLAAMSAAVLIALQLGVTHWFYLYLVWFFPLVMLVLLGGERRGHEDLLDRVGAQPLLAGDQHAHQPGILV